VEMIARLRADAAAVLKGGRAKVVLGYAARGPRRVACFVTDPAKVESLVYDAECKQNLAAYLAKPEVRAVRPVALVARPAVVRSLVLLAAESQLSAADVLVLAVGDGEYHGVLDLPAALALVKEKYAARPRDAEVLKRLEALAAMTAAERAAFWRSEFAKCTRCYACRAACPGCYCARCIVEKNVPQWISTAAADHGNYAWNVIRAFHLAGRCTECGACEAACPQGIPLMLLNVGLSADVEREFGARAGDDLEAKPVIGSWNPEDAEEFIL